ncbi:MAG TPA: carboxypeptidase-like regulatory domain-containing protein [Polyangiales bacterium]
MTSRGLRKLSFTLLAWGFAASAAADASVVVELKRADGTPVAAAVVLTKGETKYRCDTDANGRCVIKGVAGGMYQVTAEQAGKTPSKPKTAVIPPSGEVKLIVNAE